MSDRILAPTVLETKQDLLANLRAGNLKVSKYNILSVSEKLFVELVAFGDYTGEQAVKIMDPKIKSPKLACNKLMCNPDVAATLEELTVFKDKKFMTELASTRELALAKLKYIMSTTKDDALSAACAKTIIEKSVDIMKQANKKEDPVSHVRFNIQVDNMYTGKGKASDDSPIIIPMTEQDLEDAEAKYKAKEKSKPQLAQPKVNPETGMPYRLVYEGIDMYNAEIDKDPPEEESDEDIDEDLEIEIAEE